MAKDDKRGARQLDLDDVLAGRGKPPSARDLIELIRITNPTGLALKAKDTARRYAQKSRLQSLLIDQFGGDLEVALDPHEPGVIGLRYRPLDMHACHVPLEALDDDARSWVQGELDRKAFEEAHPPAAPALAKRGDDGPRRPVVDADQASRKSGELSAAERIGLGQEAVAAYDYELARTHLTQALTLSSGNIEAALPLLALLVDHLAADDEALALEAQLSAAARMHHEARLLLGLAAARAGQRERTIALLDGHRSARSAEPFLVLARAAVASGDIETAADDLAAARERDPIHPQLRDVEGALAARRALDRSPLEEAITALVDNGRIDEAEPRARALLARFPDSEVGRRVLRILDERRRDAQIRQLLADAEEAAARDELTLAIALLSQALAGRARGEQLAKIQARAEEIRVTLRDRAEHVEVENAVALLGDRDRLPGLVAYLALAEPLRGRVRARVDLPHFAWLAEIGSSERPRAAALAVIALERAGAMVAEAPQAALDRIEEHEAILRGVGRGAQIQLDARARLGAQRREAAMNRLEQARSCFEDGAFERAEALLAPDLLGALDEEHRASAGELQARIAHERKGQRLVATFQQRRREGQLFSARDAADALLAREDGPARDPWAATLDELTQRPLTSLRGISLDSIRGIQRLLAPESNTAPFVQTCGVWVFVRIVDLTARIERARYLLRTPTPMDLLCAEVDGDRVIIVGKLGAVLELRLGDGDVVGWYESPVPRLAGAIPESVAKMTEIDGSLHAMIIESAAVVPGTRLLWQVVCLPRARRRFVRVCDLAQRRVVRDLGDTQDPVYLEPLMKRREPLMAVAHLTEEMLVFHDPRGAPIRGGKLAVAARPANVVVEPGGERIVLFTGGRTTADSTGQTPIRWCVVTPGGEASPEQLIEDLGPVDCVAFADATSGLLYFESRAVGDKGGTSELRAFRLSSAPAPAAESTPCTEAPIPRLEEVFRAAIPGRSLVVQGNQRSGLVAFVAAEDELEVAVLGLEPPQLRPGPRMGRIDFKNVNGLVAGCNKPTGARLIALKTLLKKMRREPHSAWERRFTEAQYESNPERMLDLSYAMEELNEPHESGTIGSWAFLKYPDQPEVRVNQASPLTNLERWSEVRDLLAATDPASLDDGIAQHLDHMLGRALLFLGEPEEAQRVLERGESYRDGNCDLAVLIALATPLEAATATAGRAWTPDQLTARTLLAAVERADTCLAERDAAGAIVALDRQVVTETGEVQTLARRAESHLLRGDAAGETLFDKAHALAWFCAVHAEKKPFLRRELPIPRGRWDTARLDDLSARASAWLDATLGDAWPFPPGGL
jgi:hypothetical protein